MTDTHDDIARRGLFPLGATYATPGALAALESSGVTAHEVLTRHQHGDWGDLNADDYQANDFALLDDTRIFSAYSLSSSTRVWIITEADRSATTILLPDEY